METDRQVYRLLSFSSFIFLRTSQAIILALLCSAGSTSMFGTGSRSTQSVVRKMLAGSAGRVSRCGSSF